MGQTTNPSPTCLDTLKSCDKAVESLKQVNSLQQQIIQDQDKVIITQKQELDSDRAWYHDPFKTIGLGLLVGLAGGLYLGRH